MKRHTAVGGVDALAYVLALMHWRGCSVPAFLLQPPLHPSTGLIRWLSTFTVMEQVDSGLQVFDLLVLEEARIFEHAAALIHAMDRMIARRSRRCIVLLPELLHIDRGPENMQNVSVTTFLPIRLKHLAAAKHS